MYSAMPDIHLDETHEAFVRRAYLFFPIDCVRAWSRFERAVFNYLMSQMIYQHGYSAITDAMLNECRINMEQMIQRCGGSRLLHREKSLEGSAIKESALP